MSMYTTDAAQAFKPEHVHSLLILPVQAESVAMQIAPPLMLTADAGGPHMLRVPVVAADPTASWVAEGAEINASDAQLDEVASPFQKVAGLTTVSNELASDSSPSALELVGSGLARDIARQIDAAFFGDLSSPNAPRGLGSITATTVDAGTEWENLDPFLEAVANAETAGAQVTAFAAHPADALALSKLKEATGSNRSLMQPDPASPTGRVISGRTLYTSPAVEQGTVYAIPRDRVVTAIRKDGEVTFDSSVHFTSDRTAVRAITRVAFAFPHAAAVQKIQIA